MSLVWLSFLYLKNPGIIDVFWPLVIMVLGLNYLSFASYPPTVVGYFCLFLLVLWALRLSAFLLFTRILPKKTEKRYFELSSAWKKPLSVQCLLQFLFQGILCSLVSLPFAWIFLVHIQETWTSWLGILLMSLGFFFEMLCDYELYKFRKKFSPLEICQVGWWRYSRHPNYFFELVFWMGACLVASSTLWSFSSWISFLTLLWIIKRLTAPATERSSLRKRGENYRHYQQVTPMIMPNWKAIFKDLRGY